MRFKVGQKVRVVEPYTHSGFKDGDIVEILKIEDDDSDNVCYKAKLCSNDLVIWYLNEDEVESIEIKSAPITNGDKIRAMSNRELSDFLRNFDSYDTLSETICKDCVWSDSCTKSCVECLEVWLNSPVEEKE